MQVAWGVTCMLGVEQPAPRPSPLSHTRQSAGSLFGVGRILDDKCNYTLLEMDIGFWATLIKGPNR